MNRDKQIEEMGEYIAEVTTIECAHKSCEDCKWLGSAKPEKADCTDYLIAEALYNADYRKASEIAREIFEEIERLFFKNGVFIHIQSYNELKKKYTEGMLHDTQ